MVTKSSLAKKLASYSAIGAAILAIDRKADAQIIYIPINPGFLGQDTSYLLDLNGDGIIDFKIKTEEYFNNRIGTDSETLRESAFVEVIPYGTNKEAGTPFIYGNIINSKINSWYKTQELAGSHYSTRTFGGYGIFNSSTRNGPWLNVGTAYLPLKFNVSGKTYYGWARLSVTPNQFILSGYAYNATPDSAIYAGQECDIQFPIPSIQQNDSTLTTDANIKVQWYFNNQPLTGDTLNSIKATQYGIYSLTTGDTTICHGKSLPFNYLNCTTLQQPVITTTGNIICYYTEQTLQLTTSVPQYYSVQWLLNNSIIPDANGQTSFYTPNGGAYKAVVHEQGGCSDTSNVIHLIADSLLSPYPEITEQGDTLFSNHNEGNSWSNGDTTQYIIPTHNQTFNLCVTDSLGCSYCEYNFTYVNCNTFHPTVSAYPNAICSNPSSSTLTIDIVPLNYNIQWYKNDSIIYAFSNDQTYTTRDTGKYTAILDETGGCIDTTKAVYLNFDSPLPPIISQQGDSLISSYSSGNYWYETNNPLTGDTEQVLLPIQNDYYDIAHIDSLGCRSYSSLFYFFECDLFHEKIVFNSSNLVCFPSPVNVGLSPFVVSPGISVNWYRNDTIYMGDTSASLNTDISGYYFAKFFNSDSSCIVYSDTVKLISDNPSGFIKQSNDTLFLVADSGTVFPIISYQWYNDIDPIFSNATYSYYVPYENGHYLVYFTDSLGCSGNTAYYNYVVNDINLLNSTDDIQVSESNNLLNIKFINEPYFGYQLSIYNSIGQKVFYSEINSVNMIANLAPLTKGLYLVAVEKGNKRIVKKIIID